MIFYNVLFYSVILVLVVFYYWSLCVFYCFISVSAVVRFRHTENGLNSNKTELLNWIGNIIFMIQVPSLAPTSEVSEMACISGFWDFFFSQTCLSSLWSSLLRFLGCFFRLSFASDCIRNTFYRLCVYCINRMGVNV